MMIDVCQLPVAFDKPVLLTLKIHAFCVSFFTQFTVRKHKRILLARNSLLNNTIPQLHTTHRRDGQPGLKALLQIL